MKQGLSRFHFILGGVTAVPLLVIAVTGLILAFHDPIRYRSFPHQLPQQQGQVQNREDSPVSLVNWIERERRAHPEHRLTTVYFPTRPNTSLRMKWNPKKSGVSHLLYLDPNTGAVLADEEGAEADWMDWVLQMHRGFGGQTTGRVLMSSAAIALALLWPLGLIMAWQRSRKNSRPRTVKLSLKIHRLMGVFGGGFLTWMFLSGAILNFNSEWIKILDPIPVGNSRSDSQRELSLQNLSVQLEMLRSRSFQSAGIQGELRSLHFRPEGTLFYFSDNSRIYWEGNSPRILKIMTPRTHWLHMLYPLHSGRWSGGTFFILLVGASALLILTSMVTPLFQKTYYLTQRNSDVRFPFKRI